MSDSKLPPLEFEEDDYLFPTVPALRSLREDAELRCRCRQLYVMQTMVADFMDKESRQEHAELVACTKEKIAAIERAEALESALKALVDRLDEIRANPDYEAVFFTAQLYRGPYTGPSCEEQYRAARALLNQK